MAWSAQNKGTAPVWLGQRRSDVQSLYTPASAGSGYTGFFTDPMNVAVYNDDTIYAVSTVDATARLQTYRFDIGTMIPTKLEFRVRFKKTANGSGSQTVNVNVLALDDTIAAAGTADKRLDAGSYPCTVADNVAYANTTDTQSITWTLSYENISSTNRGVSNFFTTFGGVFYVPLGAYRGGGSSFTFNWFEFEMRATG